MSDLISRQVVIDTLKLLRDKNISVYEYEKYILGIPSTEPEILRCKDCKWYEKLGEDSSYGYCHAMKHCHYSKHWEISIYRTYNEDFFCADAERREKE